MATSPGPGTAAKESPFMTFPPIVYLVLGLILFVAWLAGNSMQIQTNEAWILSQGVGVLHPDLLIYRQIGNIWSGNMTVSTSIAYIYGWGVQLVLLTCKIGIERAQTYIHRKYGTVASERAMKAAQVRGGIWSVISWFIVILDSVADWQYAASLDFWPRVAFTGITFLTTFFFGTIALHLIFAGLSDMRGR